jgi:hypothetical protein
VNGREEEIVVRPLSPPLSRTLALIEHRSKRNEPALEIARNAILTLREVVKEAPGKVPAKQRRSRVAAGRQS